MPLVVGPLVAAAGLGLLSGLPVQGSYLADVLPGFLVVGLGAGGTMVSATIAATNDAPGEQEGLASALLSHRNGDEALDYTIRQTTELRNGRVVRQVNVEL